ncbi:hypothetical protein KAR91_66380 [Candidatus Pacearchaeota archaeon]|nr:hypothetical protein [Candidatus Pacearchaeota archaeon]
MELKPRLGTVLSERQTPKRKRRRNLKSIRSLRIPEPGMTPENIFGATQPRPRGTISQFSFGGSNNTQTVEQTLDSIYNSSEVAIGPEEENYSTLKKVSGVLAILGLIAEFIQLIIMIKH